MSKKNKNKHKNNKNISSQNNKTLNKQEPLKFKVSEKQENPKKEWPIYLFAFVYFALMACFCFFVLYQGEYKFTDSLTVILFIGFFAFTILFAKIKKHSWFTAIKIPSKILFWIAGFTFFLSFVNTGITYISTANLQSQDIYDIEHYTTQVFEYDEMKIYTDIENSLLYVIDDSSELEKVSQYQLYPENNFDVETIDMTYIFYPLSDNIKFSYIRNNFYNEIVLQITNNEKRYLSIIPANQLIPLLEEKDGYTEPFFDSDKLRIYKTENPNVVLSITNNLVQFTEYDIVTDIKDLSYIERVHTFLVNHFEEDYITDLNASAEIIAERYYNGLKFNLYNIGCATCDYKYGESEIMEVVDGDQSYIFNLGIDSEIFKEAVINE